MKTISLLLISLFLCGLAYADTVDPARMCEAIRISEGVNSRYPYGVKSVNVSGKAEALQVCLNSVRNNVKRWERAGKPKGFVEFMADRWCPKSVDPVGHGNWIKNVKALYEKNVFRR